MSQKYIGNNAVSTGYRVYECHTHKLLSWIDRRCVKCKRFLSKRQVKYCAKCAPIEQRKLSNQLKKERERNNPIYKEEHKLRDIVRLHPDRFSVGDVV